MGQVIVRNLDDQVVEALKALAEIQGHSLEQELRNILSAAVRKAPLGLLALSDEIRSMTPAGPQTDSTQMIREDRDRWVG